MEWFSSISMASATLFALLNGDVLHDTFALLSDTHLRAGFWGDVDWFVSGALLP